MLRFPSINLKFYELLRQKAAFLGPAPCVCFLHRARRAFIEMTKTSMRLRNAKSPPPRHQNRTSCVTRKHFRVERKRHYRACVFYTGPVDFLSRCWSSRLPTPPHPLGKSKIDLDNTSPPGRAPLGKHFFGLKT